MLNKKFYVLPKATVGQNYKLKINKLLNILKKIEFQFISPSENIAWLLNIEGKTLSSLLFPMLTYLWTLIKD